MGDQMMRLMEEGVTGSAKMAKTVKERHCKKYAK
jgi:hypothetical protein